MREHDRLSEEFSCFGSRVVDMLSSIPTLEKKEDLF
jgi:hypothetical protein